MMKIIFKTNRNNTTFMRFIYSLLRYMVIIYLFLFSMFVYATEQITFTEFYGKQSVLGFEFSDKVKKLAGQKVVIKGFMAPPLKAESHFFVLTKVPLALCPFCDSDADWPEDILVIYLDDKQTFIQTNGSIMVEGILEYGSWTDPETGFVSLLRLTHAKIINNG